MAMLFTVVMVIFLTGYKKGARQPVRSTSSPVLRLMYQMPAGAKVPSLSWEKLKYCEHDIYRGHDIATQTDSGRDSPDLDKTNDE